MPMTIKMTVSLPEHVIHFAERLVQEGRYPSLDSVLAASLEDMMSGREPGMDDPVSAMADELRRRMALPEEAWIAMDDDDLFDRVRERISSRPRA
jgi:antitoxin ParD1/3/4